MADSGFGDGCLWDLIMPDNLETHDTFWWSDNFRRMLGYESEIDFPNRLDSWSNLLRHKEQTLQAFSRHLMDFSADVPIEKKNRRISLVSSRRELKTENHYESQVH